MAEPAYEHKMKICICGEGAVGKSSLIGRFVHDKFGDKYLKTVGTNVMKKEMVVQDTNGQELRFILQVWDIMGQPEYRNFLKDSFFFGARGIIMVFDLTRPETFEALNNWHKVASDVSGKVPVVVLGNKADLAADRKVSEEQLVEFCKARGFLHYTSSAKTGENVDLAFTEIALAACPK